MFRLGSVIEIVRRRLTTNGLKPQLIARVLRGNICRCGQIADNNFYSQREKTTWPLVIILALRVPSSVPSSQYHSKNDLRSCLLIPLGHKTMLQRRTLYHTSSLS